jgi:hypothetical protein
LTSIRWGKETIQKHTEDDQGKTAKTTKKKWKNGYSFVDNVVRSNYHQNCSERMGGGIKKE